MTNGEDTSYAFNSLDLAALRIVYVCVRVLVTFSFLVLYPVHLLYVSSGKENVLSSAAPRSWRDASSRRYWSSVPLSTTAAVTTSFSRDTATVSGALNDYPCGGVGAMLKWLKTQEVQYT